MYPYLFNHSALQLYDIIGVLGYLVILLFFLIKRNRPGGWSPTLVLLLVHLVSFTFGGMRLGEAIGRGTEFFGYVSVSALGTGLAAVSLRGRPLVWLDRTVPLYLTLASVLKLSCFCAGCCNGLPWAYGLYNYRTLHVEFPIQLVEMALYALLLCLLLRYRGRPGRRFALFLTGYAGVRFAVQFFRVDRPAFSAFHWMSAVFFGVGVLMLFLITLKKPKTPEEPPTE